MRIQLLWCGNMWKIILEQILTDINTDNIWVQTHTELSKREIQKQYWVKTWIEKSVDIVLLLIKPQQFSSIDFNAFWENKTYISFMAWIEIKHIEKITHSSSIIRVMPNLALSVWKWVVGYHSKNVDKMYVDFFLQIFSKWSKIIECKTEDMIDKITVLSGSGLAYYYFLSKILEKEAQEMWFSQSDSNAIIEQTFIWSVYLQQQTWKSSEVLRSEISSKWGTTEAVIKNLEENGFEKIIKSATHRWYKKAKEISS